MAIRIRIFRPEWLDLDDLLIVRTFAWSIPTALVVSSTVFFVLLDVSVLLAVPAAALAFCATLIAAASASRTLAFALGGSALGALIGALIPGDRWEPVAAEPRAAALPPPPPAPAP